jgi:hypothetical protein
VIITGTNFISPLTITFGGNVQAAGSFSSTKIMTYVPSGATTGKIQVQTPNGSAFTGVFTVEPSPTPSPTPKG